MPSPAFTDPTNPPDASGDHRARLAALLVEVARSVDRGVAAELPSRLTGDPRLEALRDVLLGPDRAAFARWQRKIDDPQQFAAAVASVLATAVALAESGDRLDAALAPALERATQSSIRKDSSTWTGILYPLVGPTIRKSIAETLDGTLRGLNQAFRHSLSWQGLKWRWEAHRTGTTFAEVVLKYTVEFRVEHVFLIHRKTGLLLEHAAAAQANVEDPQMVSAMLTAIQDFIRDSFSRSGNVAAEGIDSVRLGDMLLWCEEGPLVLLAAVIRGNPPDGLRATLRETLATVHHDFRNPLEAFDGDGRDLSSLGVRLEPCLQEHQQRSQDDRLSPWLWALPLALFLIAGTWMAWRTVDRYRVDAYVDRLRSEPGMVVTAVERHGWRWEISGLRDPLATDPGDLLEQARLNPQRVAAHFEPFQALNPAIVMKRFEVSLPPPPTAKLSLDGGTIRVNGSAPQYWVDRARAFIDTLPAGSPRVDLGGLTDVQDPTYIRLRDAIEAHLIAFDSNAPRPASGQDTVLDAIAAELRDLIRVAKGLGFSVRVMIVGHTDSTGAEIANLALSAARAEVVRSMLRDRGIAPESLLVRSAGIFEPVKSTAGADDGLNRRVTFTVSTAQ